MSKMSDADRALVLAHNRDPHGRAAVPDATHRAVGENPLCGDRLVLKLRIEDDRIAAIGHETEASALTLAATSVLCVMVQGLSGKAALALSERALRFILDNPTAQRDPQLGDFNAFVSVIGYPNRLKTVTLPWATLRAALLGQPCTSTDHDVRGSAPPEAAIP